MAEPVTLLQATPGRVKVLREMEEHPYSVSDTVDYPESPMQTVMPPTEEAVGGGVGAEYDGPWSVSIVDPQARTVAVKNGFYSVNGYIVNPTRTTHTLTIPHSDYRYIIYLEVTWNDSLTQLDYEVKVASYFNSVIEGYHDNVGIQLLGDVSQSSGILKSVTNYKNALPQVMIFGAVPV